MKRMSPFHHTLNSIFNFLQTSPKLFFMSWDSRECFKSRYLRVNFSKFSILLHKLLTPAAELQRRFLEDFFWGVGVVVKNLLVVRYLYQMSTTLGQAESVSSSPPQTKKLDYAM